jgi:tRNA A37 threonylcarbamoyladenosine biosynthesis protein TsaE
MFFVSKSPDDTRTFASALLRALSPRTKATILGLTGELGAGKTTLAQCIAEELGIHERVTSPTYVIFKTYNTSTNNQPVSPSQGGQPTTNNFKKLVHVDAYRLQEGKDLESLGWKELISDPHTLIVLEWPERVAEILPSDIVSVVIDPINKTTRNIEVSYGKEGNT